LRSIIRTIFLRAERLKQTDLSPEAIGNFPEFLRFKDLVEHDFKRTRSVIDYTSKLGLSTRKLNRITQHVLGMNAKEIIDARIILEIQRLLSHSQMSLKEITDALGFDESTNLVKYFRKRNGNTPMEFRSTLGNNGIFLP